jgi:vacuolar-type H+-ATPase subunit H
MDKKPDQIERDIREYRDQVSSRIVDLRTRARDDVDKVRSEARSRTSGGVESAKSTL